MADCHEIFQVSEIDDCAQTVRTRSSLAVLSNKAQQRLDYIYNVLGEDRVRTQYHPATLRLATEGVYCTGPRDRTELTALARELAEADAVLSRLGRGVFSKMVRTAKG